MLHNIYLLIGPSGSGKTTIADLLDRFYGLKSVCSYTTRPPRQIGEKGHIFVDDYEFNTLGHLCAYTEYDGYRYGVTDEIIDTHDIYVIDPRGARCLKNNYKGHKIIRMIRFDMDEDTCRKRMASRGDSEEAIEKRIEQDRKSFGDEEKDLRYNLIIPAFSTRYDITRCITSYISCCEGRQIYMLL